MLMRHCWLTALVLFVFSCACIAQETPTSGPSGKAEKADKSADRETRGRMGRSLSGLGNSRVLKEKMTKRLALDEGQQAEFDRLLEAYEAEYRKIRSEFGQTPEYREKMLAVRDAMREARESGDKQKMDDATQRAAKLRDEHRARKEAAGERMESAKRELHDNVLSTLRDDQKVEFEKLWSEYFARRERQRSPARNPAALRAMISRLDDVTPEQKERIEAFYKQHRSDEQDLITRLRSADRKLDRAKVTDEREKIRKKLFDNVLAVLTTEQRKKIEARLNGTSGRRPGRGTSGRGPGSGAGDRPAQPDKPPGDNAHGQPTTNKAEN